MADDTPRTGQHGGRAARQRHSRSAALKRALAYVGEASPLLAELLQAEAEPTPEPPRERTPGAVVRADRIVNDVTYAGSFRVEGEEFPYLAFVFRSRGLSGQVHHFTRGFKVRDPKEFARMSGEFAVGEEAEIEFLLERESSGVARAPRLVRVSKFGGGTPA